MVTYLIQLLLLPGGQSCLSGYFFVGSLQESRGRRVPPSFYFLPLHPALSPFRPSASDPVTDMEPSNQRVPWGNKRVPGSRQTPAKNTRAAHRPSSTPLSSPSEAAAAALLPLQSLRQGAVRGTRSIANQEIVSAFEWEALTLEKAKDPVAIPATDRKKAQPKKQGRPFSPEEPPYSSSRMSRNRPRGPPMPRDNGLAANEETDMWNKILQDLRKAKEKNDKQKLIGDQIHALNEKIGKDGGSKCSPFYLFSSCDDSKDKKPLLHLPVGG